ncbi:uncharacterized protein LOC119643306 [Glossina fuscipes]|uniref:Uncharacterized protein LOC119643306 n=1 Tax=Glossina fuscipes TaxID=7396 RepID=A0A9C6DPX3_9MUSC|nr:uncharacterized protein LOC119643306 [Glossina fuscipes]
MIWFKLLLTVQYALLERLQFSSSNRNSFILIPPPLSDSSELTHILKRRQIIIDTQEAGMEVPHNFQVVNVHTEFHEFSRKQIKDYEKNIYHCPCLSAACEDFCPFPGPIDTPVSPPHFDREPLNSAAAPLEYSEHNSSLGATQDVDRRQLHLPPFGKLGLSKEKSRQLDIDHWNLISLTGSPGANDLDKKSWLSASADEFKSLSSSDVDYRRIGQNIKTIETAALTSITTTTSATTTSDVSEENKAFSGKETSIASPQKDNKSPSALSKFMQTLLIDFSSFPDISKICSPAMPLKIILTRSRHCILSRTNSSMSQTNKADSMGIKPKGESVIEMFGPIF